MEVVIKKKEVLDVLRNVYDPDYRDKSIVEMGLVTEGGISVGADKIEVEYKVTAPMCPFSSAIRVMIKHVLEEKFDRDVIVRINSGHPIRGYGKDLEYLDSN